MSRNLIAILRGIAPREVLETSRNLVDIGFTKIEVPMNSPEAIESISILVTHLPGTITVGAGTVLTTKQVDAVDAVGGQLIVSPDCNPTVIDQTLACGMESWPGVATATEAFTALRHDATGLKLFPGTALGPGGLAALKAVLPKDVAVFPVGGAAPSNFADWVKAGATGFGVGSALYKPGFSPDEVKKRGQKIISAYDAVLG